MTNPDLAALSEAATKGELYAMGWGDGSTQMGMTNLFNDDAAVCLMECIPEADAKFIAALWNAYRSGDLVLIDREALREKCATAIHGVLSRANVTAYLDMPVETAGWCADAAIAAILGEEKP